MKKQQIKITLTHEYGEREQFSDFFAYLLRAKSTSKEKMKLKSVNLLN